MIGRRVKESAAWTDGLQSGIVIRWEPLSYAMCDVLVESDDGHQCWYSSTALKPIDDLGPLPSREVARVKAREEALRSLEAIRAQHIANWRKPWPGAEHGKAIVGRAIDGAIADLNHHPKAKP